MRQTGDSVLLTDLSVRLAKVSGLESAARLGVTGVRLVLTDISVRQTASSGDLTDVSGRLTDIRGLQTAVRLQENVVSVVLTNVSGDLTAISRRLIDVSPALSRSNPRKINDLRWIALAALAADRKRTAKTTVKKARAIAAT